MLQAEARRYRSPCILSHRLKQARFLSFLLRRDKRVRSPHGLGRATNVLVFIRAMRRVFGEFSAITVTICGLIAGFRSTGMPVSDPFADSQIVPGFPSIIKNDTYASVYTLFVSSFQILIYTTFQACSTVIYGST